MKSEGRIQSGLVSSMLQALSHRGPDETGIYETVNLACGVARLSIVDIANGHQPLFNEDKTLLLICNGEIFNHASLRAKLISQGHKFKTNCDVEVLLHLYEEHRGPGFLSSLNGQFAFVICDLEKQRLIAARDHFGICPLHYAVVGGIFAFASEIKALLQWPSLPRTIDLKALDQVFSLTGIASPRTILQCVKSLQAGHYVVVENGGIQTHQYWDIAFPPDAGHDNHPSEEEITSQLQDLLCSSVSKRLLGDVPVGVYLSGGLDSSLVAAMMRTVRPADSIQSFSIVIEEDGFSERPYQDLVAKALHLEHRCFSFPASEIGERLRKVIYHCECPLKELHNSGALALSEFTRACGFKAILSGQGADELFAGYVGYRFDALRNETANGHCRNGIDHKEKEIRRRLWDDESFFYEKDQASFLSVKRRLYSGALREALGEAGCLNEPVVEPGKLKGLHPINKRSYVDFKLRLADHLLADHGDRMCLANSLEMRHPFLDQELVNFVAGIPVCLKLRGYEEKYVLKQIAYKKLPRQVVEREKFGFAVPGSPALLRHDRKDLNEVLDEDRIAKQGYFDPAEIGRLKKLYREPGFEVNVPFEDDLLVPVLTFGLLLDIFNLPALI
jgi:asparagine synthase (glutamine-hydrolysing)